MIFELTPMYDKRKSFYHKALVENTGKKWILYSYETPVCEIDYDGHYTEYYYYPHSRTTDRHVKEFKKQYEREVNENE